MPQQIKFIQRVGFSGEDFVTEVVKETEDYLYYYDEAGRWCSIPKKMEDADYINLDATHYVASPLCEAYEALDYLYQVTVIKPTVADETAGKAVDIIRNTLKGMKEK